VSIAIVRKAQLQKIQMSVWSLDLSQSSMNMRTRSQPVRHQAKAGDSGAKSHATGDGWIRTGISYDRGHDWIMLLKSSGSRRNLDNAKCAQTHQTLLAPCGWRVTGRFVGDGMRCDAFWGGINSGS
jgi:hypothetical protein